MSYSISKAPSIVAFIYCIRLIYILLLVLIPTGVTHVVPPPAIVSILVLIWFLGPPNARLVRLAPVLRLNTVSLLRPPGFISSLPIYAALLQAPLSFVVTIFRLSTCLPILFIISARNMWKLMCILWAIRSRWVMFEFFIFPLLFSLRISLQKACPRRYLTNLSPDFTFVIFPFLLKGRVSSIL